MTGPRDPLAAATHPDPYPYYADLVARRPLYRDDGLGLWIAASAAAVTAVLTSEHCRVRPAAEPVPGALVGFLEFEDRKEHAVDVRQPPDGGEKWRSLPG